MALNMFHLSGLHLDPAHGLVHNLIELVVGVLFAGFVLLPSALAERVDLNAPDPEYPMRPEMTCV